LSALSVDEVALLRTWIGREEIVHDVATPDLANKLHATLSLTGPVASKDEAMPLLAHFCLAQPAIATDALGHDGHPPKGGFLPPVPLPRRMWAGGRLQFQQPLRVGDEVTKTSRIADVQYKEGRSGPLCFVTVTHELRASGTVLLREEQDIVYRAAATAPSNPPKGEPAAKGEHQRRIEASTALLFRYSALTFNGHRIHYDRNYAIEEEFYPGLVFHGPLQATLLINFATEIAGREPRSFEFRSLSPLYDMEPVLLNATRHEDTIELWTAHPQGPIAMSAKAVF
jgi:3-methylfumaryl-CoA hydratase